MGTVRKSEATEYPKTGQKNPDRAVVSTLGLGCPGAGLPVDNPLGSIQQLSNGGCHRVEAAAQRHPRPHSQCSCSAVGTLALFYPGQGTPLPTQESGGAKVGRAGAKCWNGQDGRGGPGPQALTLPFGPTAFAAGELSISHWLSKSKLPGLDRRPLHATLVPGSPSSSPRQNVRTFRGRTLPPLTQPQAPGCPWCL